MDSGFGTTSFLWFTVQIQIQIQSGLFSIELAPTPAVMYGEYKNKGDFLSDFQKMYKNSVAYNGKNDQVRFLL